MQVQTNDGSSTFEECEGFVTSCDVGQDGNYKVLDHTNQLNWLNIVVDTSSDSGSGDQASSTPSIPNIPSNNSNCTDNTKPCLSNSSYTTTSNPALVFSDSFDTDLIFNDLLPSSVLNSSTLLWERELMLAKKNQHQKPGVDALESIGYAKPDDIDGRRDAGFFNDYMQDTAFVTQGNLVQRGVRLKMKDANNNDQIVDSKRNKSYYDPRINNSSGLATLNTAGNVNYGDEKLYTSFLSTVSYSDDNNRTPLGFLTDSNGNLRAFGPGTFFEIKVSFEQLSMEGHRHSFFLMPAVVVDGELDDNAIVGGTQDNPIIKHRVYDGVPSNGLEIDIYEHEYFASDSDLGHALFMKAINGERSDNYPTNCSGSAGASVNAGENTSFHALKSSDWDPTNYWVDGNPTHITFDNSFPGGSIRSGYHTIGLYYGHDELVWFVDGYAVLRDNCLVPNVDMYLVVSRELNTGLTFDNTDDTIFKKNEDPFAEIHINPEILVDGGLWGGALAKESNLQKMGQIVNNEDDSQKSSELTLSGKDYVLVDYVKVWSVNVSDNGETGGGDTGGGDTGGGSTTLSEIPSFTGNIYSSIAGDLFWGQIPEDDGTYTYVVKRNSNIILERSGVFYLSMDDLQPCTTYNFTVHAFDTNQNTSPEKPFSMETPGDNCNSDTTQGGVDPLNLRYDRYNRKTVELFWSYVYHNGEEVQNYLVYKDNVLVQQGLAGAYLDKKLNYGQDYEFKVVAMASDGTEVATSSIIVNTAGN